MRKILLDTNFLLIPIQFKVDIFSEIDRICLFRYKLYVVDKTIDELKSIILKQKGKSKAAAKVGLQLAKRKGLRVLETKDGRVDDLILELMDKDWILASQDEELRKLAGKKGAGLLTLRAKKYLILK
jgi:rRNA-processing protein FCF1